MPYKKGRLAKDLLLTAKLRKHGARHSLAIIQEARRGGVPLSWALALVEQETAPVGTALSFRTVFGGDHGHLQHPDRAPFYHVQVTAARVRELLRWISNGGVSNGVGLTQLTSVEYIQRAEGAGGAHRPRIQLRVGFAVLLEKTGGDFSKAWHYNGSPAYQPLIAAKQQRWSRVIG